MEEYNADVHTQPAPCDIITQLNIYHLLRVVGEFAPQRKCVGMYQLSVHDTQGIINHPPHSAWIRCLRLPLPCSHGSNFKKRFNYVKIVSYGTVLCYDFCYGEERTVYFIYIPDFVVINISYIIKN